MMSLGCLMYLYHRCMLREMLGMTLAVCCLGIGVMDTFGSDDALLLEENLNYLQQMLDYRMQQGARI